MSNFDVDFKERVVRKSVAAGLIFGIVSTILWALFDGAPSRSNGEYALFFGIPLGLITFISGLVHYKSHNPLGKFLPFATTFVYLIFFASDRSFSHGLEISFGIFLCLVICLVSAFLIGLLKVWIDKGK